jgi:hypothetical protein
MLVKLADECGQIPMNHDQLRDIVLIPADCFWTSTSTCIFHDLPSDCIPGCTDGDDIIVHCGFFESRGQSKENSDHVGWTVEGSNETTPLPVSIW